MLRSFALILVLPACTSGPPPNAALADLPGVRVSVQQWAARDGRPAPGYVSISYDDETFIEAHGGDCATLDDVTARFNGATFDLTSHGSNDDEFGGCYFPSFEYETQFTAEAQTTLTIHDGTKMIAATFAATAFAPHTATLRSGTAWSFSPGEAVTIGWSHPDDLLEPTGQGWAVSFNNSGEGDDFDLMPTFSGDEIRFTIPNPPPSTGDGIVGFQFGYSTGDAISCEGATACRFSAERGFQHRATIE